MRAFLIDPHTRTISQTEYNGDSHQINELIGADTFTAVYPAPPFGQGDTIYLDDEGLFQPNQAFFMVPGYPDPLAGKALVLGSDAEGESADAEIDQITLTASIRFVEIVNLAGTILIL